MYYVIVEMLVAGIICICYLFFKKRKNVKWIIARIVICSIVLLVFTISMITVLANQNIENKLIAWLDIPLLVGLSIFIILDIYKLLPILDNEEKLKKEKEQKQKEEALKQLKVQQARKKIQNSKQLLEQCGMRFFIKYYHQIKNLPLRDVVVEENYTPEEKNERLNAAKIIIVNNLTKLVVECILEKYSNALTEEEIDYAQQILLELQ